MTRRETERESQQDHAPLRAEQNDIEVRRSARRKRTVTAFRENGHIVVLLPESMSKAEERRWVQDLVARVLERERRARVRGGDAELLERARQLHRQYLEPLLQVATKDPVSVTWVTNQNRRWGSCTPTARTIRLSHRLRAMPAWVVDYVLLHELAHLYVADHSPRFWHLLQGYARTELARGYLQGWQDAIAARARSGHPVEPLAD